MVESLIEEYVKTPPKSESKTKSKSQSKHCTEEDVAAKRESLAILTTLGTSKDFIGVKMTLGDVKINVCQRCGEIIRQISSSLGAMCHR